MTTTVTAVDAVGQAPPPSQLPLPIASSSTETLLGTPPPAPVPAWTGGTLTGSTSGFISGSCSGTLRPSQPHTDDSSLVVDLDLRCADWTLELVVNIYDWHGPDTYRVASAYESDNAMLTGNPDTQDAWGYLIAPADSGSITLSTGGPSAISMHISAGAHVITLTAVIRVR